jgi:hypothetical protein
MHDTDAPGAHAQSALFGRTARIKIIEMKIESLVEEDVLGNQRMTMSRNSSNVGYRDSERPRAVLAPKSSVVSRVAVTTLTLWCIVTLCLFGV